MLDVETLGAALKLANKGGGGGGEGGSGAVIDDSKISSSTTWSSQKIVDTLCPPFTTSGAIVQCTPVANYPLSVQASWGPRQEGSGDPSPDNIRPITGVDSVQVTRCGKNLLDISNMQTITRNGITFQLENGGIHVSGTATSLTDSPIFEMFLPSGTYICNLRSSTFSWLASAAFVVQKADGSRFYYPSTIPFTINEDEKPLYWYFVVDAGANVDEIIYPQIELGSTATPYEPYSGSAATLDLPETIYGGTVDAVTGVGSKTWGFIASYNGEAIPGEWISDRDVYSAGATPTTGAQVAYKLATPTAFQATGGQSLPALPGTNTLYADAGDITVTGASDPIATITALQSRVSALESAALN